MLKQILPLLFTFIFSINLFAESHDIHKDISDIKLQIQEIKLLDARDDRGKKIENLEEDIKKLEEKFNKSDVDKKELDGKIERNKAVVDNLNTFLTIYGILITILLALGSFATYKVSLKNAEEGAEKASHKWIEDNKDRILEPIINEGNNLLKNIRKEADALLQDYQLTMKNHNLKNELDSKEKDILEKVNILLESKETKNYTFNDWHSKFLDYFYKNEFENAVKALDNAINVTTNEIEIVIALMNKGIALGKIAGKPRKEIEVYDELIERFSDSEESAILEQVTKALYNKGVILGKLGESKEAIEVYDEVIRKFSHSKNNSILEKVASVLLNKIELNLILGNTNSKEDLELYFNLVKEDLEELLKFEMLQIFEKAKNSNQDEEISKWQLKFKDTKLEDWSFDELKIWSRTLKDEVKKRVLNYIDIFENHNKNIGKK